MQITVQLHQPGSSPEAEELDRIAGQLGVVLQPIHPDTTDPDLRGYFTVEAPDRATADKVIAGLRQSKAVAAAYVKPPDAMP
jgi:hypothetical protein